MDQLTKAHIIFSRAMQCLTQARALYDIKAFDGAINRAYYAMFHAAEAALMAHHGLAFRKHGGVVSQFGLHFAKTGLVPQELHISLVQAFEVRNHADYDMLSEITEEEATDCCKAAEEFIQHLQGLL